MYEIYLTATERRSAGPRRVAVVCTAGTRAEADHIASTLQDDMGAAPLIEAHVGTSAGTSAGSPENREMLAAFDQDTLDLLVICLERPLASYEAYAFRRGHEPAGRAPADALRSIVRMTDEIRAERAAALADEMYGTAWQAENY